MSILEDLKARYAFEMTERERATLEAQIWSLVPRSDRDSTKPGMAMYMSKLFSVAHRTIRVRQYLLRAGSAADPLWDRVQKDMTLSTALNIMQEAWSLKQSNSSMELSAAVIKSIEDYDKSGDYAAKSSNGKLVRRKRPNSIRGPTSTSTSTSANKIFWNTLRAHIGDYAKSRLEGTDPVIYDRILRSFEADLNILFEDFQQELSKAPRAGLEILAVSRKVMIQACNILGMDPPKPGKPVNMKLASTQRKRFGRMYHPDVSGGSKETTDQYMAAMEAYRILQKYSENFTISNVKTNG